MVRTQNKVKENRGLNYSVSNIERDNTVITPHGIFGVTGPANKVDAGNTPLCYDCFYDKHKITGAPCIEETWCGNLYQVIKPIRLNKNGQNFQISRSKRLSKR